MTNKPPQGPLTYWDYIHLEPLLDLQSGIEGDESVLSQDEVVFITVHQVYELWFKLILRDLTRARDLFAGEHVPDDALAGARRLLDRGRTILELAAQHLRLVETITTRDFLDFRDKLFPANGGQSPQFREVEILLGLGDDDRIPYVSGTSYLESLKEPDGSAGWAARRVAARQADRPSLKDAVDEWLYRTPLNGSRPSDDGDDDTIAAFISGYLERHEIAVRDLARGVRSMTPDSEADAIGERYDSEIARAARFLRAEDVAEAERPRRRRIRAAVLFIEVYRELPLLAWPREILDGLVAVEQAFISFRQRHARMTELIIGRRVGTGGSSGVEYLDQAALSYRVFRDLWGVRTLLVRRDHLPDPAQAELYGFRFDSDS